MKIAPLKVRLWLGQFICFCARTIVCTLVCPLMWRPAMPSMWKGAKYTRSHPPVKLLRVWDCANHSEALKLEHYFKGLSHARKLYAVAYGLRSGIPKDAPLVEPH